MCLTPGSVPARSSSTPSKAASPSRPACGLHSSVQPGGVPGVPGGGGAPLGDAFTDADADADADGVAGAPPGADPVGPGYRDAAPATGDRRGPSNGPNSAATETTALAAR